VLASKTYGLKSVLQVGAPVLEEVTRILVLLDDSKFFLNPNREKKAALDSATKYSALSTERRGLTPLRVSLRALTSSLIFWTFASAFSLTIISMGIPLFLSSALRGWRMAARGEEVRNQGEVSAPTTGKDAKATDLPTLLCACENPDLRPGHED